MTGRISDAKAEAVLDEMFGSGANNIGAATYYMGLSVNTTAPSNTGGNVTEPVGNGYARVEITNNATNFPAAANRVKTSGSAIVFPTATGGTWGTVKYWMFYESATGTEDFDCWAALDTPQLVSEGSSLSFATGAILINSSGV